MQSQKEIEKLIYVPQGRGARLNSVSGGYNIRGLYTDAFSSCVILAIIGSNNRSALIHVDPYTPHSGITEEIDFIGGETSPSVILFFREQYSKSFSSEFCKTLSEKNPKLKIQIRSVGDYQNGILLIKGKEPRILPANESPGELELLHHPEEQYFLAIQKIGQIIGYRAKIETGSIRAYYIPIFDGQAWEPMKSNDKKIDTSNPMTASELSLFSGNNCLSTIETSLSKIIESINRPIVDPIKDFIRPIAFWLEGYLNDYDGVLCFIRNMKQLLDENDPISFVSTNGSKTELDKSILTTLYSILSSQTVDIKAIDTLMDEYRKQARTQFAQKLMQEYETFKRHLADRDKYKKLKTENDLYYSRAKRFGAEGQNAYRDQKYEAATNLFIKALQYFAHSSQKNDINFVRCHFNMAMSLKRLGNANGARIFFENVRIMCSTYMDDLASKILLEKVALQLSEIDNLQSGQKAMAASTP